MANSLAMNLSNASQARDFTVPTGFRGVRQGFAVAGADMAARIGLVDLINASVPWDPKQCKVSPGVRILALILAMLVDPMALYRLVEFYAELDCDVLFGLGRAAQDFNDDAIGRALTKLFESQIGQTYSQLCRQAVDRLGLPATATLHADTTSITLTGEYPDRPYPAGPEVTYGHNKDGHSEHKQLVAGVVTRSDGVPLAVDVLDGNADDPTWSHRTLLDSALWESVGDPREELLFVADSKAVSHEAVKDFCEAGVRYVSRLPNTFGLELATKRAAAAAQPTSWDAVGRLSSETEGSCYRLWETTGTVGEQSQRLIVVHSSALAAKAEHQVGERHAAEAGQFDRAMTRLGKQRFACAADAEAAWETWSAAKKVGRATWQIQGTVVKAEDEWRIEATRGEPATDRLAAEIFRRSTLILISNDPRRTARGLLEAYKSQFVVEQAHAMLKGPLSIVPIFLKDPLKITAYIYVAYMALLLWKCMEAVMRQNQAQLGMSLPYPNKRLQPAPTTKRLKEIITPIEVVHWHDAAGHPHRVRCDLSMVQRQALLLLGMDPQRFVQVPSG